MPMAADGAISSQGLSSITFRAAETMLPQEGVGGCAPRPRKDNPVSIKMAKPRLSDVWTRIGAATFGRMAVRRMRPSPAPTTRAACTYSLSRTARVAPKTTRTKRGMYTMAMTIVSLIPVLAVFFLAQRKADASADLSAVYDAALPLQLKKDLIFFMAQRKDDASLAKLIAIAKTDPEQQLRKDALFYLGQSKDPRALKALEELVIP